MTSPVDTSVKFFHSEMPNCPVLSGTAGSLIGLLDACLKDGFGLKSTTALSVASGVATLTVSGVHSAVVDGVILVSGAATVALNGEQKVTAITANTVSFATAAPNVTDSGTVTFKMAPLGWAKPFSDTNIAVYKPTDPLATGMLLRVDDTSAQFGRVVGYETMSDVNTGTGPFPTSLQMSGGGVWPKSIGADAVGVGWTLCGDGRVFYLHIQTRRGQNAIYVSGALRGFGDMQALRPSGDAYACALAYLSYLNDPSNYMYFGTFDCSQIATVALPRDYSALGSSMLATSQGYTGSAGSVSGTDSLLGSFPSPVDGALRLSKRFLSMPGDGTPRCDVPGVYTLPHSNVGNTLVHHAIVPGAGVVTGRRLLGVTVGVNSTGIPGPSVGLTLLDVTGPWR